MNILVTGGAGFVGSHLCHKLIDDGHTVFCMDNLYTGFYSNISSIKSKRFTFINHDVNHPLPSLMVDRVYNLASPASPPLYQKNPIFTMKTNTIGLMNVLDMAMGCKARVLQASTSEVYGDPEVNVQNEGYHGRVNTMSIRSCYDESKRCSETIMSDYKRMYGAETRIVRLFNVYGPNLSIADGRVVSNFIYQAIKGNDITIYGDGNQTRSFQYVTDAIEGLVLLMESGYSGPVNIGNPVEFTVKALAEKILLMTGSDSKIVYKKLPEGDPKQRRPDISLAKKVLNWEPKVSLNDGLMKTITVFKDRYL